MRKFIKKFNIFLSILLLLGVTFSVAQVVLGVTPNPGHPWTETGDGVFAVTGPTSLRTFTFPDADATVLTGSGIAKGGIITGTAANTVGITTVGTDGQVLSADAASTGGVKWITPLSGLTIGTTTITSGTTTRVLYDNGGVLGEMTTTGSGTVLALATSPSFTTPNIGAATASGITLSSITGSVQCLHVNSSGVISGTGSDCGSGSGTTPPGGDDTEVQFNDSGVFNGITGATTDGTTLTLVAPVLGAATATSINKVAITAPASSATLTIDDGFTLHATGNVTALSGSHTGTSSGTNTGDQTSVTGNAGTATALQNARTIGGVSFDGTANITVATATGGFTVSGGNLGLGTNSLTLTGSIGATGARVTKGWFTDIESTNAPTLGGVAATGSGGLVLATSPTIVTPTIAKIANLTGNGFVKTSGGDGTLSIDTNTYLTSASGVSSITGTANQITASAPTGAVTLSLPSDVILTTSLTSPDVYSKGISWTSRTTASSIWTDVTYGNGTFVAVSGGNEGVGSEVMTSPDGINWTTRTASADKVWNSVVYGNGIFVAVSQDGSVMTSPTGVTWTTRTASAVSTWFKVTYGNGTFVAVSSGQEGVGTEVMTSPDGITWTSRTAAVNDVWRDVTYGNGLFVAVASGGASSNRIMTSPDGITWTARTPGNTNALRGVTYGNGLFVVVSTGTFDRVMTSPDGITWTARTASAASSWYRVTYGNGLFVAISDGKEGVGTEVMTSPDGITWTSRTAAANNTWYGITYGNGSFVAISADGSGNRAMTSGKTELNDVPSNNIYQGGITVKGNAAFDTITSGTWNGSVIGAAYGGTGVANNAASTITISGSFGTTLTVSGTTAVTLPTSGTLYGTASGSITSSQLLTSLTDETGSGVSVFATSPTLVTPVLGVASATTINKVALTAPATGSTLTIADGKTLTASDSTTLATNSITFGGGEVLTLTASNALTLTTTGSTNVTLPTSGTLAILGANTFTGDETFTGSVSITPAAGSTTTLPFTFTSPTDTALTASTESTPFNINTSATRTFATGALTTQREVRIQAPTYAFAGASTLTNASTVDIGGFPIAGTNATITSASALSFSGAPKASATSALVNLSNTALASGSANGTYLGANPAAFTGNFIEFQVNGTSEFKVTSAGSITGPGSISGFSGVTANSVVANNAFTQNGPATAGYRFASGPEIYAPASGVITLAGTTGHVGFTRLTFGNTTSSFSAIGYDAVNGITLQPADGTATWNDGSTAASGTVANRYLFGVAAPTLTATNSNVTDTVASTFYIGGAPTASTNTTIGTAYALNVAAGNSLFGGNVALGTNSLTLTGSIASTGSRVTKGWFTDLEVSNAIVGSITGNAATVTTNANLTGAVTSSGNATSLGSFSSANLLGALTDETGTGVAVFGTAPTFTTSITGAGAFTVTTAAGTNNLTLSTGGTSGAATGNVNITSGTVSSGGFSSGAVNIDSGAGGGSAVGGTISIGSTNTGSLLFGRSSSTSAFKSGINTIGTTTGYVDSGGDHRASPILTVQGAADTSTTGGSSNLPDVDFAFNRNMQFLQVLGIPTTQTSIIVRAPTYSATGAGTITDAATLALTGAPVKSTNISITNTHGLLIQAGAVSTATNSFGLTVNAQTGASNNYAAQFLGGNVGIGNSTPGALLDIGTAGATLGVIRLEGNTSGYAALQPTAAAGDVTITLPATTGTVALTANKLSAFAATTSAELAGVISDETGSGLLVYGTAPTLASTVTIGTAGGTTGAINIKGTTSGTVTLTTAAAAGTYTLTLPTDNGDVDQFLQTDGSGGLTWATAGGSSGLTVGSTTITSGTDTRVLYDNAGVLGEMTTTGSGTVLALATSPSFTTPSLGAAAATGLTVTSGNTTQTTTSSGISLAANSLTSGTGFYAASSTLTGGKLVDLQVSGTAATASQTALNILTAGATATNAITTYGAQISNTHTNATSGTNVALYLNASGATTANYGLIVNAGSVGIGTTAPAKQLDVLNASTAQIRLSSSASVYGDLYVDSSGDIQISATGNGSIQHVRINEGNLWACAGGSCGATTPITNGNVVVENAVIFDNNFKLKKSGATTVDMLDSGDNIILQFDEVN